MASDTPPGPVPPTSPASARDWLLAPVDGFGLGLFRALFGLLMAVEAAIFLGRVGPRYLEPALLFPYEGLEWLRPWPGPGLYLHCVVMGAVALALALGVRPRACAAAFAGLFAYLALLDQTHYRNHYYLIVLLAGLLAGTRSGAALALAPGPAPQGPGAVPRYQLLLLRAQLVLVYAFAGVAKLNADWLAGEPIRHWLQARAAHGAPALLAHPGLPWAICWGGLLFDLAAGPLLLWGRTRPVALVLCAGFHLTNAALFEIGVFPWLMLASLVLFVAPERLRGLVRAAPAAPSGRPAGRLGLAAAGVYLARPVALPLRHWAYPGDVAWTEEGHRFAWRMKLRAKRIHLLLLAHEPDTGALWAVDLSRWLRPEQVHDVSMRPVLIWQLARRVREDLERERGRRVEVRVRAHGTLNFRPRGQDLIDPAVDLSRAPCPRFAPAPWIVPLEDVAAETPALTRR